MKFFFGDIVVVNGNEIGVVVKSWFDIENRLVLHEVYCRMSGTIAEFDETEMERYMVRHKYLDMEEVKYQREAAEVV